MVINGRRAESSLLRPTLAIFWVVLHGTFVQDKEVHMNKKRSCAI